MWGDFLRQNPGVRINSRDLAQAIVDAHPDEAAYKKATSSQILDDQSLVLQVQAQIGASWRGIVKKFEKIIVTADRPRLFYWDAENEIESSGYLPNGEQSLESRTLESSLYPILRDFLEQEKSVFSMRIDEKRSKGKGGSGSSHWLHPDLVGIQLLSKNWGKEAQTLAKFYGTELIKIWSFEVKVSLTISNARSSYFQAVSNSSWSHFGYLVAEKIDQRALEELEILSSAHGIGVMLLDSSVISNSSVLIPAQERSGINWNSANRLAEENRDFANFLKSLERLHQTGDVELVGKQFEESFKNKRDS